MVSGQTLITCTRLQNWSWRNSRFDTSFKNWKQQVCGLTPTENQRHTLAVGSNCNISKHFRNTFTLSFSHLDANNIYVHYSKTMKSSRILVNG